MHKVWRWIGIAVVAIGFLMLVGQSPVTAQSKTLFWQRWDVTIDNVDTTANRFVVTEVHDIQFTSGVFTFGFRSIPIGDRLDSLTNIQVFDGETPLRESCGSGSGTFCVSRSGDELEIVYYFSRSVQNERRVFTIKYQVDGGLRYYEGGDQIDWFAVAPDHSFPIRSSTVTVHLPGESTPRDTDPAEAYYVPAEITQSGSTVTFVASREISADEAFEIRVQYPHNPAGNVAGWQASFDRRVALEPILNLLLGGGSVVVGILGVFGMYYRWWTRGRDPEVGVVPEYLSEPPSALPPAVAGTLMDERADMRDVLSTLIDLGRRGYLVIEEDRREGILGLGGGSEFTFKLTGKPKQSLRGYERMMLDKMFRKKTEVDLDDLKNKFYVHIPRIQKALYKEVVRDGFFEDSPESIRSRWIGIGVGALTLAGVGLFGAITLAAEGGGPAALFCVPIALGMVGIAAMIAGPRMPAKTEVGAEEAAKWKAFREYLKNIQRYADVDQAVEQFNDYLPYAVAFGLERTWTSHFSRVSATPVPYWYYPRYAGGPWSRGYRYGEPMVDMRSPDIRSQLARPGASLDGMAGGVSTSLNSMSAGLFTMLNTASSTMNSRPSSSSSGGGGFSGGFSGGGGGGGGGSAGFG